MIKCFPFKCGVKEKDADLVLTCSAQALINVKKFKEKGNEFYNSGKYQEAVNEYTKALSAFTFKKNNNSTNAATPDPSSIQEPEASLDTQDTIKLYATLLSNRSVSYKKIGRYENSKKDAEQVIIMRPTWFKVFIKFYTIIIVIY